MHASVYICVGYEEIPKGRRRAEGGRDKSSCDFQRQQRKVLRSEPERLWCLAHAYYVVALNVKEEAEQI